MKFLFADGNFGQALATFLKHYIALPMRSVHFKLFVFTRLQVCLSCKTSFKAMKIVYNEQNFHMTNKTVNRLLGCRRKRTTLHPTTHFDTSSTAPDDHLRTRTVVELNLKMGI